jgi:hypothetical protein
MASLVVWQLKTVPDYSSLAVTNGDDNNEWIDRSIHRSIICIGRLIAFFDVYRWKVDTVYAWHVAQDSECDIIKLT